jgi:hypothetical protein
MKEGLKDIGVSGKTTNSRYDQEGVETVPLKKTDGVLMEGRL